MTDDDLEKDRTRALAELMKAPGQCDELAKIWRSYVRDSDTARATCKLDEFLVRNIPADAQGAGELFRKRTVAP